MPRRKEMKGGLGGDLPVSQMVNWGSWRVLMLNASASVGSSLLKRRPGQSCPSSPSAPPRCSLDDDWFWEGKSSSPHSSFKMTAETGFHPSSMTRPSPPSAWDLPQRRPNRPKSPSLQFSSLTILISSLEMARRRGSADRVRASGCSIRMCRRCCCRRVCETLSTVLC